MRALAIDGYGDTSTIHDLAEPALPADGVLVRVRAAGVNPADWKLADGLVQETISVRFPLTLGFDVAGVVTAAAEGAPFTVGEEVFGVLWPSTVMEHGTFAELVPAPAGAPLAVKPAGMSFEQAAALPMTGGSALRGVQLLELTAGDTVLIVGASGSLGSYAVQMAAGQGARVIATTHADDADYLRGLGAAQTIDYTREDVGDTVRQNNPDGVDALLDVVSDSAALAALAHLVRPGGRVVSSVYAADVDALAAQRLHGVNLAYAATTEDMSELAQQVQTGRLHVLIGRTYPLDSGAEALDAERTGHVRGKIVLSV